MVGASETSLADGDLQPVQRELRLHIVPTLGGWPLASLRREHVEAWVADLPLAPSSSALVAQTLGSMLASAVEDERIVRNPVTGARLPAIEAPPVVPLTVEQIRRLAAAAAEHIRAAVVVVAGTGLRQGELFGLTVDRIDFLRRELRVDQQLWTPKRGPAVLAPVKSRNSYRTVGLSQVVTEALAAHLAAAGPSEGGLVFHTSGRPISRSSAWKLASKAGVASGVGRMVPVGGTPTGRGTRGRPGMTCVTTTRACCCPGVSAPRLWPNAWATTSRP